jgi:2',3'-cyclic-nucleotide 2'-phosphodiesterase (5'-nucleotidase family)
VRFTIDGPRAIDIRMGKQALSPRRSYRVASNSYLIRAGGSGYTVLTQGRDTVEVGMTIRQVLEDAVKATPVIKRLREPEDRIRRVARTLDQDIRAKWGLEAAAVEDQGWPFGRP